MLEALRVRDFRLLFVGRFISLLGTWLVTVAVPPTCCSSPVR